MSITLENKTVLDRRPRLKKACRQLQDMAEELGAGSKLPTLIELRSQLGVSVQTLSDAVRELEKSNVLRSVHGVGIYVTGEKIHIKTGNVGFLAPYNMRPEENVAYWGAVIAGMRSAARDRGYNLLLIDNGNEFKRWDKIDGVVICDTDDPRDLRPTLALPQGFPCISILNKVKKMACVTTNDFDGAYQLTRHLIELGHRRIAFLATVNAGLPLLNERKEGYLKALQEANIVPNPRWIRELRRRDEWDELPSWYPQAGQYHTECWLKDDWDKLGCTALMAQNDETARGAIEAFETAGLKIPRDISVVGYDGMPSYHILQRLTTIQVPLFDIGERAMRALLDWLGNPTKKPQNVCLPVNFVQGQTTGELLLPDNR